MRIFKIISLSLALLFLTGCGGRAPSETPEPSTESPTETTNGWPEPDKVIALTFDDGPSTETMVQVLDLLTQYDAKATFFVIGKKINGSTTPVLQRAVDEGHEIGNHSMNHLHMAELTEEEILAEFNDCQQAVKDAVGVDMYYFRAPFGSIDDRMYRLIPAPFMGAGVSAGDGTIGSIAADRAWKVTSNAYDGAIVLMHCFQNNTETVEALKTILPELKAQGYEFVTLTELFTGNGGEVPAPTPGTKFLDNSTID